MSFKQRRGVRILFCDRTKTDTKRKKVYFSEKAKIPAMLVAAAGSKHGHPHNR